MRTKTRIAVAAAMLLSSASMAAAAQSAADSYRPGENSTFETPYVQTGGPGSLRGGAPEDGAIDRSSRVF
jgi:Spy/CpxP family protein refolding chaperone